MKKKFSRILGVGLAIVLLISLMVAALPASAGTLSWGAEKSPTSSSYENTIVSGINIIDVAANGDIVFAATDSTAKPLYKSTDGGATWSGLENTTSFPPGVSVKAVAVASDDPDVVAIITSANEVEYSTSGGSKWTDLNAPSDTNPAVTAGNLSAIDISPGATRYLAVGGENTGLTAELFTIKLAMAEGWQARYTGAAGITPSQTEIMAVRYSPNYATDKAIAVVSGNASSSTFQLFHYDTGDYDWNGSVDYLDATDWGTGQVLTPTTAIAGSLAAADIALPATFLANDEGERLAFVAVAGTASGGGLIRLTDIVQKDFQTWSGGNPGAIGSLVYSDAGKVMAGSWTSNRVYQYLSPTATTPKASRVNTLKQPGGAGMTSVALSGDTVIAGTRGDESAVAKSTDDGYSFNDVALIDTKLSVFDDFAVNAAGSKVYLTTHDAIVTTANTTDVSVWLKEKRWTRVLSVRDVATADNATFSNGYLVRIAPDDDAAVYLASRATRSLWVSKNSGMEKWKAIPNSKVTGVQDFVVESADVVYALDTATGQGVSKTTNAGASWGTTKEPTKSLTPYMITLAPNGDILYGGTGGYVAFSKDGGATFERMVDFGSAPTGYGAQVVAHPNYADNNLIYVGIGTSIKRRTVTTSTAPASTRGSTTLGTSLPITGIAAVGDVVYVLSANSTQNSVLYKSFKMEKAVVSTSPYTDAEWSWVNAGTTAEEYLGTPRALRLSTYKGSPKLWAIDTKSPALESFTDAAALAGPTLVSPANEANVDVNPGTGRGYDVTFIWERYADTDIDEMQLQIATDSAFDAVIYDTTFTAITTNTIARVIGPTGQGGQVVEFMPGGTYYWRVRNGALAPMYSPWSETRSFTVEAIAAAFGPSSPAVGSTDVARRPTLAWAAYSGALGYEVQIAADDDPNFTVPIVSRNTESTFYLVEENLAYSTAYYWRVRPITGESYTVGSGRRARLVVPVGEWAESVFTTMAKPAAVVEAPEPTAPIVITEPGETTVKIVEVPVTKIVQPEIPTALLYVIVGIGAVLIIALIVLIVRTRRVT